MKVAVVHDYLTQRGGAERVVLSMLKAFPDAPVHTALYDPGATYPEFADADVRTMSLNRAKVLRRSHRLALPALAPAFSCHRVEADAVLCSSSGWAHGVRAKGRKIVYCYTPARWLYDGDQYLGEEQRVARLALNALRPGLVRWDRRAAATADRYLTLSTTVQRRIQVSYGVDAEILPPPPTLGPHGPHLPVERLDPGFFLCVSRLMAYKNVDAVVAAFTRLPEERLVVVGAGPERRRLETAAGDNVTFLGSVPDEQLRWLFAASVGIVAASYEDYGLTPLEGFTFGKPATVLRAGGFLDTVLEDETGVFFDEPTPDAIADALRRTTGVSWQPAILRVQAERFGEEQFIRRLQEVVNEETSGLGGRP
ncbi:MAG: glycosyltransferase [Nocardioides sp.]